MFTERSHQALFWVLGIDLAHRACLLFQGAMVSRLRFWSTHPVLGARHTRKRDTVGLREGDEQRSEGWGREAVL